MAGTAIAPAPWRAEFLSHFDDSDGTPTFVLSTVHPNTSSSTDTPPVIPRARNVGMRGMWASLPPNSRNVAPLNPQCYESDIVAITTDARMEKVSELHGQPDSIPQSFVGGPVEGVFWAPEPKIQWRLRGRAYIIGPDIESDAGLPVRRALSGHMRRVGEADEWSWSKELTAHFGNLSPGMRGSFRNPPPGTPISRKPEDGEGLGQEVDDLDDPMARSNFRVLLVVPEEVDKVDLIDPKRARRWIYKLSVSEGQGKWETTEVWP